eukprot:gene21564-27602_t
MAAGVTLESFEISTCDENWQPTAFSSSKGDKSSTSAATSVNKLATVKSLGIYWQVGESVSISKQTPDAWEASMQALIYKLNTGAQPPPQLQYILTPYKNSLFLRLTHNKKQTSLLPRFDVLAESSNLQLDLDSEQYRQLFSVMDRMNAIERTQLPFSYCPLDRPTMSASAARAWWRYALKLVLARPRYIRLVKLSRVADEDSALASIFTAKDAAQKIHYEERLSFETLKLYRQIAILEMTDDSRKKLLQAKAAASSGLKHIAIPTSPTKSKHTVPSTPSPKQASGGWFGWLAGSGGGGDSVYDEEEDEDEDDAPSNESSPIKQQTPIHVASESSSASASEDISIESIISSLNHQEETLRTVSGNAIYLRFSINSSSVISLHCNHVPIVRCNSTVAFSFTQATAGISFACELKDFLLADKYTLNPPIPNIISVKQVADRQHRTHHTQATKEMANKPTLSVLFENKSGKSRVVISALPIEITLNRVCISKLLSEFGRPENRYSVPKKKESLRRDGRYRGESPFSVGSSGGRKKAPLSSSMSQPPVNRQQSISNLTFGSMVPDGEQDGDLEIVFEAYAPKIILPEDSTSDRGYLLLDAGYLAVNGSFGKEGFKVSVSLKDINAGLPQSTRDMYSFADKSLYLIKPFDLIVNVQNENKIVADMTVNVEIKPELRGEIDSVKLARLLKALGEVSGTFSGNKSSAPPLPVDLTTIHLVHGEDSAEDLISKQSSRAPSLRNPHSAKHAQDTSDSDGFLTPLKLPASPQSRNHKSPFSGKSRRSISSRHSARSMQSDCSEGGGDGEGFMKSVGSVSSMGSSRSDDEDDEMHCIHEGRNEEEDEDFLDRVLNVPASSAAKQHAADSDVDPLRNDMHIRLSIPVLALDLAYNVQKGHHLVLAIRGLQTTIINRPYDKRILFDLSEVSIQDSFRSASQRDLAWTPRDSGDLVHVAYSNVNSTKSPLYTDCASQISMDFSCLCLNMDVNTVNHLKPFFDVLFAKSPPPPPSSTSGTTTPTHSQAGTPVRSLSSRLQQRVMSITSPMMMLDSSASASNVDTTSGSSYTLGEQSAFVLSELVPSGMKIAMTFGQFSVDLLRTSAVEKEGRELDTAFSLQISGMRCDLDMFDLMKADVVFRSVEIFDIRRISKDYVFRKVFCPAYDSHVTDSALSARDETTPSASTKADGGEWAAGAAVAPSGNQLVSLEASAADPLIHITYSQESKNHSYIKVVVTNVTSFVSIDTILDLTGVASVNFFALLGLFSGPPKAPDAESAPPSVTPVNSPVKEGPATEAVVNCSTMNVVVQVVNPRLILLEDPASYESQAIVGRCGIEVHYTRESKTSANSSEMFESLHVTLFKYEVFVLRNMMKWTPTPILEPLDIEFHLKRKSLNGEGIYTNLHFEIDHVEARVTFNDLVLAQSILSRRTLTEPVTEIESESDSKSKQVVKATSATPSKPSVEIAVDAENTAPSLVVHFGLSSLSLVTVNDFNGQSVPILRMSLDDTRFFAEGRAGQLGGDGTMNVKVDFYNPSLSLWESVLDHWRPGFKLYSLGNTNTFEVRSEHTMQLTASGVMLETLLRSYSVFFHEYDELVERSTITDIVVHNSLGAGEEAVQLWDSGTKTLLMTLEGGQSGVVSNVQDLDKKSWIKSLHLPSAVDVHFLGQLKSERMPLFHLPFNINKPMAFNLQPLHAASPNISPSKAPNGTETSVSVARRSSTRAVVVEPILEEVFENNRYDPLAGRWRQPYLMGDPFEWTEASGTIRRDIQSVALTSDKWEWQGKWEVDMHGVVGSEIDADGWEYASSFSFFSIVSPRRTAKAMDTTRRRRWTRTRVPVSDLASELADKLVRPLTVFWDVKILKNGSRTVDLRSNFQVSNLLSFPVLLALKHNSWSTDVELGPVGVGQTLSVPLKYSYAAWIRIKPTGGASFEWSGYFPSNIQTYDFKSVKDVTCQGASGAPRTASCFRVITSQTNKSLLVALVPYIVVTNKLLCGLRFVCSSSDGKSEDGSVESGCKTKLCVVNLSSSPKLIVTVGNFGWSAPIILNTSADNTCTFQLSLPSEDRSELPKRLVLTLRSRIGEHHGVEVDILSQGAFVDRSGLNLFLSSKIKPNSQILRSTCGVLSKTVDSGGKKAVASVSSSDSLNLNLSLSLETPAKRSQDSQPGAIYSSALKVSGDTPGHTSRKTPTGGRSVEFCANLVSGKTSRSKEAGDSTPGGGSRADEQAVYVGSEFGGLISELFVNSLQLYELKWATAGQYVHTDNKIKWSHLPPGLNNRMCLSTAFADRLHRSNRLVRFKTIAPCSVYVCVDIGSQLKWLQSGGFHRTKEMAVARRIHRGVLEEFHYAVYGKHCAVETEIALGSSWNKRTNIMYSVFIVPSAASQSDASPEMDSLARQVAYCSASSQSAADQCWTEGSDGLSLFYAVDGIITVGANRGSVWSDEISVDTSKNAASKGSLEIESPATNMCYQLSYSLSHLPGLFHETQLVTFMPRYCVLSCVEEVLFVSQHGSEKFCEFQPYKPEGWHKLSQDFGTNVQFRTASTQWSLGSVDINEIGASIIYMPSRLNTEEEFANGTVLHIEVKLADPADLCSIIVIIWRETVESKTAMCIRNDTDLPITVRQAGIEHEHDISDKLYLFEVCVPGNESSPFGWADPECGTQVLIGVGDTLKGLNRRVATVNLLKSDQMLRLPYNFTKSGGPKGEVVVSVITKNGGYILQISKLDRSHFPVSGVSASDSSDNILEIFDSTTALQSSAANLPTYGLSFVISSFGVSLVVEKPVRRELLSLYIDGLDISLKSRGSMQSFELSVADLQVDNYSETVIYPVMLRSQKKEIYNSVNIQSEVTAMTAMRDGDHDTLSRGARPDSSDGDQEERAENVISEVDMPFIKLTVIKETQPDDASTPTFKYVAFRVLSVAVEVDSATMQLLFTDLLNDLKVLTQDQALALTVPSKWVHDYNMSALYPEHQYGMMDVYRAKFNAQRSKMYFKNLIVHPVKLTLTFVQTTFPRRQHSDTLQSTVLNVFMALVGVEKLQLRLKSFAVEDAMESTGSLIDLVLMKAQQDLRSQVTSIAGSLAMIGSPIGFARKVGGGVKAFFYEPYLGAVHGSQDFVIGIGKGTSSLFSAVASGAMDSAVAIVGTATKGISYLSGDADYVRQRALIRQQSRANRGGIFEGIKDGGESVMSGFASGMSGLVSKPIEGAGKSGISGFFKGIGLGLMGAAVKPVMGLSDGLTSVAHGISNQVDPNKIYVYVRPPRALEPSVIDETSLVIVPLNLEAAFAQEFVMKRAKQSAYEDSFLSYIPLDTRGEGIILSSVYVYWRRAKSLWGRVWANISHVVFTPEGVGILLYSGGKNGGGELVVIPCSNAQTTKRVYSVFASNAHRMGYPSKVVPVDALHHMQRQWQLGRQADSSEALTVAAGNVKQITAHSAVDISQLGALDGYRFGLANNRQLQQITGSEIDVLKRAQHYIEKGCRSWKELDEYIWSLLWEWGCVHSSFGSCRCCVTLFVNRSDSPIQITRVQMVVGRNVVIMGSPATGYEAESRCILPNGYAVIFICAFAQSPLEVGHLQANINTAAFSAVVASTQRESFCEAKGGFTVGFLEKTVNEWWCKYVVVIS